MRHPCWQGTHVKWLQQCLTALWHTGCTVSKAVRTSQMHCRWNKNFAHTHNMFIIFFLWRCDPKRVMASSFLRFLDHTKRRTTVGRTPLGEWSANRRDLHLTTHNTHNRQISIPPVGFEPTISAGERPQTYALDRAANGTGNMFTIAVWNRR